MAAGGGDLERQERRGVAADVGQVGLGGVGRQLFAVRDGSGGSGDPERISAAARRVETPAISSPSTSAASRARSRGTIRRFSPARRAPSATASAPGESRSSPPSDSSPNTA